MQTPCRGFSRGLGLGGIGGAKVNTKTDRGHNAYLFLTRHALHPGWARHTPHRREGLQGRGGPRSYCYLRHTVLRLPHRRPRAREPQDAPTDNPAAGTTAHGLACHPQASGTEKGPLLSGYLAAFLVAVLGPRWVAPEVPVASTQNGRGKLPGGPWVRETPRRTAGRDRQKRPSCLPCARG